MKRLHVRKRRLRMEEPKEMSDRRRQKQYLLKRNKSQVTERHCDGKISPQGSVLYPLLNITFFLLSSPWKDEKDKLERKLERKAIFRAFRAGRERLTQQTL